MWLRIENTYIQDPTIHGIGFMIRNDDVDGSRLIVKKCKTARRKCLAVLRKHKIPAKMDGDLLDVRDMIISHNILKMQDCVEVHLKWDNAPIILGEMLVDGTSAIVTEIPAYGKVENEAREPSLEGEE